MVDPISILKQATGVALKVQEACRTATINMKQSATVGQRMGAVLHHLNALQSDLECVDGMQDTLSAALEQLMELQGMVEDYLGSGYFKKRYSAKNFKKELEKADAGLGRVLNELQLGLSRDMREMLQRQEQNSRIVLKVDTKMDDMRDTMWHMARQMDTQAEVLQGMQVAMPQLMDTMMERLFQRMLSSGMVPGGANGLEADKADAPRPAAPAGAEGEKAVPVSAPPTPPPAAPRVATFTSPVKDPAPAKEEGRGRGGSSSAPRVLGTGWFEVTSPLRRRDEEKDAEEEDVEREEVETPPPSSTSRRRKPSIRRNAQPSPHLIETTAGARDALGVIVEQIDRVLSTIASMNEVELAELEAEFAEPVEAVFLDGKGNQVSKGPAVTVFASAPRCTEAGAGGGAAAGSGGSVEVAEGTFDEATDAIAVGEETAAAPVHAPVQMQTVWPGGCMWDFKACCWREVKTRALRPEVYALPPPPSSVAFDAWWHEHQNLSGGGRWRKASGPFVAAAKVEALWNGMREEVLAAGED